MAKNILKQMSKVNNMRKDMKQMQKELAKKTVEASAGNGLVKAVAKADMTIASVTIDEKLLNPESAEKLNRFLVVAINGALKSAQKKASQEMTKMAGGLGGLADMLGGMK
jgi:DNA-binding YbaB/EbfC family protein